MVIKAGKGRSELVTITANTHLVTKQFGKGPPARGNFPLENESNSDGFLQGFVFELGHLFTEVGGPADQVRWMCGVPGPPWAQGRSPPTGVFSLSPPWQLLCLPSGSC